MGSPPFIPRITYLNTALATKNILVTLYPPSTWRLLHDEASPRILEPDSPHCGRLDSQMTWADHWR
jgi:hypothetical protein